MPKNQVSIQPLCSSRIGGGAASGFQLTVMGGKMICWRLRARLLYRTFHQGSWALPWPKRKGCSWTCQAFTLARKLFQGLAEQGMARLGTQSLIKHYGG